MAKRKTAVKVCQMTIGEYRNYYECGKPAKFISPDGLRGRIYVCGLHARAIDLRLGKRCIPLTQSQPRARKRSKS